MIDHFIPTRSELEHIRKFLEYLMSSKEFFESLIPGIPQEIFSHKYNFLPNRLRTCTTYWDGKQIIILSSKQSNAAWTQNPLGIGGFGKVKVALKLTLEECLQVVQGSLVLHIEHLIAVKAIKESPKLRHQMEFECLQQLSTHPITLFTRPSPYTSRRKTTKKTSHIPRTYISQDLIDGEDMFYWLGVDKQRKRVIPTDNYLIICRKIAESLLDMHHHTGKIHCDLKIENLMICEQENCLDDSFDNRYIIKVIDFGFAAPENAASIEGISPRGTPLMNSPEMTLAFEAASLLRQEEEASLLVKMDFASDIYSLGLIMLDLMNYTDIFPLEVKGLVAYRMPDCKFILNKPLSLNDAILNWARQIVRFDRYQQDDTCKILAEVAHAAQERLIENSSHTETLALNSLSDSTIPLLQNQEIKMALMHKLHKHFYLPVMGLIWLPCVINMCRDELKPVHSDSPEVIQKKLALDRMLELISDMTRLLPNERIDLHSV